MLQRFGYTPSGESLEHDTEVVLNELADQLGIVLAGPNHSCFRRRRSMACLFVKAARKNAGGENGRVHILPAIASVRAFEGTGELPYDVMRLWFANKHGPESIASHFQWANITSLAHAAV